MKTEETKLNSKDLNKVIIQVIPYLQRLIIGRD